MENDKTMSNQGDERPREYSKQELEEMGRTIKGILKRMGRWQEMFGAFCFNVWGEMYGSFKREEGTFAIQPAYLCAFAIFQRWDEVWLSRAYPREEILREAPHYARGEYERFMSALSEKKLQISQNVTESGLEPIKAFAWVFTHDFLPIYWNIFEDDNPAEFFQRGAEVLFLLEGRLKEDDPVLYEELKELGDFQEYVDNLIRLIGSEEP
jgi:hypothetical protein